MEIFHSETPFNRWLTIRIENGIFSLDFSDNKHGKEVEGEIKDLLISFFSSYGKFLPSWEILNTEAYSPFQIKLYKEVRKIKAGETLSYKELAEKLGCNPRRIGRTLPLNKHALFIPCHRIVRKDGSSGGYRWNTTLKKWMLRWEHQHP